MADKIAKIKGCEVQDFDLAEAQSGQASAVTDTTSVMVKTSGGGYIEIPRDELVKAFATVMASNNQITFNKLLGVAANGSPMGIEANNLASVLGAGTKWPKSEGVVNSSWNNLAPGIYWTNQLTHEGAPSDVSQYGVLVVMKSLSDRILQIYAPHSGSQKMIKRVYYDNSWTGWV